MRHPEQALCRDADALPAGFSCGTMTLHVDPAGTSRLPSDQPPDIMTNSRS